MPKKADTQKLIRGIFSEMIAPELRTRNAALVGPTRAVRLSFDGSMKGAYTKIEDRPDGRQVNRIVIGGPMIAEASGCPGAFASETEFSNKFDDIVSAIYALNYHELGHIMFTDMVSKDIVEYKEKKFIPFLHNLFNLLEDPKIEELIDAEVQWRYPSEAAPEEHFAAMKVRLFLPQCTSYVDNGSVGAFMQYLLLCMRCGEASIPNHNAVFDKYSADILPQLESILTDDDGTSRLKKTVAFGEWLIENVKEFNWDEVTPPDPEDIKSGKGKEGPSIPVHAGGDGDVDDDGDDDKESKDPIHKPIDPDAKAPKCKPSGKAPKNIYDSVEDDAQHVFVKMSDETSFDNVSAVEGKVDEMLGEFTSEIHQVSSYLTLFKGRVKPRAETGYLSGRLDIRKAMQEDIKDGCDLKLFSRPTPRGRAKDLAVTLLCDNSGSMAGDKSHIATQAALIMAQACDWAKIPFECDAFTRTSDFIGGVAVTQVYKTFDEPFRENRAMFGAMDYDIMTDRGYGFNRHSECSMFDGNWEEVNIPYVAERLLARKNKTKLMFVFCDGATCGSREELKKVIRKTMDDGVKVIGIGICSNLSDIYPESKNFGSVEELKSDLVPYLMDTLSKYAV